MDVKNWSANVRKLVVQRNIFLLFSTILCCAVILLSSLLFFKNERIVVVPSNAASFWVENNKVSESYLEQMGVYLSDLLLNQSPSDAEWKNRAVLEHVHPVYYHEIRKQLSQDKKSIVNQSQAFVFQTEIASAHLSTQTFVLEGVSLVLVGKQGSKPACSQMVRRRYTLGFQCQNHRLLLVSLKKEDL